MNKIKEVVPHPLTRYKEPKFEYELQASKLSMAMGSGQIMSVPFLPQSLFGARKTHMGWDEIKSFSHPLWGDFDINEIKMREKKKG